jgi:hypothetical protein
MWDIVITLHPWSTVVSVSLHVRYCQTLHPWSTVFVSVSLHVRYCHNFTSLVNSGVSYPSCEVLSSLYILGQQWCQLSFMSGIVITLHPWSTVFVSVIHHARYCHNFTSLVNSCVSYPSCEILSWLYILVQQCLCQLAFMWDIVITLHPWSTVCVS